jgi:prevent-host-death family protein
MPQSWPVSDAQAQFDEVVANAEHGEAQIITMHGEPAVVVLAYAEYQQLIARTTRLSVFMQTFPHDGIEIECVREQSYMTDTTCFE